MKKILTATLCALTIICLMVIAGCDANTHTHDFSATYVYDEYTHWKECSDETCTEKAETADHSYQEEGTINTCTVCGYQYNSANTCEITLQTLGETVLSGVTITLRNEAQQQIAQAKTNVRGKVKFSDITPADYIVEIDDTTLPKGYYVPEEQSEIRLSATEMTKTIKLPSSLIDEQMPSGHRYYMGDVAHDFRTTSINASGTEKTISLSAYLSQYKAVVLNFWYSTCGPCKTEFPVMNDAYVKYREKLAVIAINSGADSEEGVARFVEENEDYVIDFVNDSTMFSPYNDAFSVSAWPTTVIIDRYGAIAFIETGMIDSLRDWETLFEHYTADDYVPNYVSEFNGDGSTEDDTVQLEKPNVEMPSSEEIATKITKINDLTDVNTFTYLAEDDEYSWPWILTERESVSCLKTSNKEKERSYSILFIEVDLRAGQQVFFDYFVSTENDTDILYVQVDTVLQHTFSGKNDTWNNDQLLYVAVKDGTYRISLTYQKNATTNAGEDTVYIKNLRIEEGTVLNKHYDLLYNATDNYTLNDDVTVPEEYKGYLNHVAYYYNETDGFYHVALSGNVSQKSPNDPILLADLYYATPWNTNSVWNLAFAKVGLFNEADPDYKEGCYEIIEDYSWLQNQSSSRYVPLNKELQQTLVDVVTDLGRTDHSSDPHNGVDQWLEVCRYYVHYGTDTASDVCYAIDNTVEALKWRVAKDYGTMTTDTMSIHVDVYSVHMPRGNYYRFKTTKAGAYLIRSHADLTNDYDSLSDQNNPLGFICDENGNILEENDDYVIEVQGYGEKDGVVQEGLARYALYDDNFYLYVYLEANTTYYVAGCFNNSGITGEYDVTINYLGATYSYFTACANDATYTYDENDPDFNIFILPKMGKDRFFIGDDGKYYAQEFDGSQGSLMYIRLIGPTFYYGSYSQYTLEQIIENIDSLIANGTLVNISESDKLYLKHMLMVSRTTYAEDHELYGYVEATQRLVSIINTIINGVDTEESTTYSQTSWLLTAYYYRNVNELTLQQAQAKYN